MTREELLRRVHAGKVDSVGRPVVLLAEESFCKSPALIRPCWFWIAVLTDRPAVREVWSLFRGEGPLLLWEGTPRLLCTCKGGGGGGCINPYHYEWTIEPAVGLREAGGKFPQKQVEMWLVVGNTRSKVMEKVSIQGDHWIWTGARNPQGYGMFWDPWLVRPTTARIIVWRLWNRQSGLLLEQAEKQERKISVEVTCGEKLCVRPEHLEARLR